MRGPGKRCSVPIPICPRRLGPSLQCQSPQPIRVASGSSRVELVQPRAWPGVATSQRSSQLEGQDTSGDEVYYQVVEHLLVVTEMDVNKKGDVQWVYWVVCVC